MTGTHGIVICLKCLAIKKNCKCKIPDYAIKKPEWIIESRMKLLYPETKYAIELHVEGGGIVEIPCKNKEEWENKSKIFQKILPNHDWRTKRRLRSP